ncbi:oxygenase MpaB family protein [Palleronia sp. LCG004]|uniref:oxygenase MpaB family protein n=1 Tax=Palleronia sp. LCG004 TaxID=3079304 RepID=UPI0029420C33|nr:oxygenase MpaB family protein [Palleronia sp. LCG004]WOI58267.1 oxygenase MpaB family protein [Palleronia sp. LCG004]
MSTPSPEAWTPRRDETAADRIAGLDPEKDHEEIARLLYAYEFSWDIERALEFALFRTYAIPSISDLLARTGEFEARPRKRYNDTELILAEAIENGLDSDRGGRAIARMNDIHGRYRIANADMLYVLSTFVCEPIRWLDRFGRRPMTAPERRAWFLYYRGLGLRMGIDDIPDRLDEMVALNEAHEAERFRFARTNHRIGAATRDLLLGFYLPRGLIPIGRPVVHAFLDAPLRDAMGFPPAPSWLIRALPAILRLRARLLRRLPARRRPRNLTRLPRPTYPGGYAIERLGTFPSPEGGDSPRDPAL